ncbi:2'-5' RNA ligase family protein [Niabella drilacis]|uniref:2'-5' RNA ligase superfamily protein n=1 Tax=Niabella drilacis (strain DSM 25811 / CCM 8410 / CCUG 62505 / LMG 26954 / E90) TaxID=1285928 RepID=A0A1G6WU21_NIADE|nr:2'-5' RNA ligase family protein [Niabella drilacis]SDD69153.1 2'-5' RNA ligase superfamily protein [Niabella drilacis]
MQIRRQLTLFVNAGEARELEQVRKEFNPAQYRLIKSHVTFCREDEIEDLPLVLSNLQQIHPSGIAVHFGPPVRFDHGLGVMLPASGSNAPFHQLRLQVLSGVAVPVKRRQPHITLMHPRNATCTNQIFYVIQKTPLPTTLKFDNICLIEQVDGEPWRVLEKYELSNP